MYPQEKNSFGDRLVFSLPNNNVKTKYVYSSIQKGKVNELEKFDIETIEYLRSRINRDILNDSDFISNTNGVHNKKLSEIKARAEKLQKDLESIYSFLSIDYDSKTDSNVVSKIEEAVKNIDFNKNSNHNEAKEEENKLKTKFYNDLLKSLKILYIITKQISPLDDQQLQKTLPERLERIESTNLPAVETQYFEKLKTDIIAFEKALGFILPNGKGLPSVIPIVEGKEETPNSALLCFIAEIREMLYIYELNKISEVEKPITMAKDILEHDLKNVSVLETKTENNEFISKQKKEIAEMQKTINIKLDEVLLKVDKMDEELNEILINCETKIDNALLSLESEN